MMVRTLLPGSGRVAGDAADALAVALCHAHHQAGRGASRRARWPRPGRCGDRAAARPARRHRRGPRGDRRRRRRLPRGLLGAHARRAAGRGEAVDLHVETQLRAESITLYGFREPAERVWFRLLQTVQGVGARVALGLLSVLAPDELARAVAAQDKAALTRASGVGPRLADPDRERAARAPGRSAAARRPGRAAPLAPPAAAADALSALVNLGYGRSEARPMPSRRSSTSATAAAKPTPRSRRPPPPSASRPRSTP